MVTSILLVIVTGWRPFTYASAGYWINKMLIYLEFKNDTTWMHLRAIMSSERSPDPKGYAL